MQNESFDVVVIGGGNAALCAALSAAEQGAKVALLERAPEEKRGGNSNFTGGGFRMVHHGAAGHQAHRAGPAATPTSPAPISANTPPRTISTISAASRSTTSIPISPRRSCNNSTDTVHWLMEPRREVPAELRAPGLQPRGPLQVLRRRRDLRQRRRRAASSIASTRPPASTASTVRYGARAMRLVRGTNGIEGVRVLDRRRRGDDPRASAVVLACGGFEANREWRTRYLGPGWDMAKVRGTRYNTGDGIQHGARHRRAVLRPMVGLPRGGVGALRQRLRRRRRPAQRRLSPQLSVRHHGQCRRQALRR